MSVKPSPKRSVTVTDHSAIPTSRAPVQIGNVPSTQKDLHPLPQVHLDAQDVTPQGLQKKFMDMYEAFRTRTDAMAKNPLTAPAYEKRIQFTNSGTAAAFITQTFKHSLGRAPTHAVTCIHSEGAPYQGFTVANPNGEDPAQFQTVTALVPAGTTAFHSFMLSAD